MWVVGIVAALLMGDLLIRGSLPQLLLVAPWLLVVVWFVYVFLFAPRITATPDGVAVHNVLKTTNLSWGAVREVRARWQVEFVVSDEVGGGVLQAWGAPTQRPSRSAKREHPSATHLERLRAMLDEAEPQTAARSIAWDTAGIVAGAVVVAWLVVSIAIAL